MRWTRLRRSFAACPATQIKYAGDIGAIPSFDRVQGLRDSLPVKARVEPTHPGDPARMEEYRQVSAELLAEADAMLKGDGS